MKKLLIFIGLQLILLSAICQQDTTKLQYPRIAYPGELVLDTCVEITPFQAKLAAIDANNADTYKEESDSLKSVVNDFQNFVNLKNEEIRQLNFDRKVRDNIINDYNQKETVLNSQITKLNANIKTRELVDKIVIPGLGSIAIAGIIYAIIRH